MLKDSYIRQIMYKESIKMALRNNVSYRLSTKSNYNIA